MFGTNVKDWICVESPAKFADQKLTTKTDCFRCDTRYDMKLKLSPVSLIDN